MYIPNLTNTYISPNLNPNPWLLRPLAMAGRSPSITVNWPVTTCLVIQQLNIFLFVYK